MSTTIINALISYVAISFAISLPIHLAMALIMEDNIYLYSSNCPTFWEVVWKLDIFDNINIFGKIIIEILYTIIFLPFLIFINIVLLIGYLMQYLIVVPFVFIFKKRR